MAITKSPSSSSNFRVSKFGGGMSKSGGNDGLRYARTQDAAGAGGGALGI